MMSGLLHQTFPSLGFVDDNERHWTDLQDQQLSPDRPNHLDHSDPFGIPPPLQPPSQRLNHPNLPQVTFEHLTTPSFDPMYLPPETDGMEQPYQNGQYHVPSFDLPHYPAHPVAGPSNYAFPVAGSSSYVAHPVDTPSSFIPAPYCPPQVGGFQFGGPMEQFPLEENWQNPSDWDDEGDYREGEGYREGDGYREGEGNGGIYGGPLEVSPRLHSLPPSPPDTIPRLARKARRPKSDAPPSKIKHRRRTSPEQLKVLEHWFDINPKPDNNLREWLASEFGMTKRNVQVWFQNR